MSQKARKYTGTLAIALVAFPASNAQNVPVLDEVVVTAQRREQSIQDVPISISAFGEEQLRDLGIDSTMDLAQFTPGLTIGQSNAGLRRRSGARVRDLAELVGASDIIVGEERT